MHMSASDFPAHILDKGCVQSVCEHCQNTADYAAKMLNQLGLENTGKLLGIIHDGGKCTSAFKEYR